MADGRRRSVLSCVDGDGQEVWELLAAIRGKFGVSTVLERHLVGAPRTFATCRIGAGLGMLVGAFAGLALARGTRLARLPALALPLTRRPVRAFAARSLRCRGGSKSSPQCVLVRRVIIL